MIARTTLMISNNFSLRSRAEVRNRTKNARVLLLADSHGQKCIGSVQDELGKISVSRL